MTDTTCQIMCYNSWDVKEIFSQEGIDTLGAEIVGNKALKKIRQKNIDLLSKLGDGGTIKIPHISHHIWFTSGSTPREIGDRDIRLLNKTINSLNSESKDWTHTLWTTNKSSIPNSITKFEAMGGQVKEIREFLNNPIEAPLKEALDNHAFGMASDILRAALVNEFGGIYFDLDYELYRSLDTLTKTFNLFIGMDDHSERYFGNAFIAATPHHPVVEETVTIINRNFNKVSAPDYIKYPCTLFAKTITSTGPTALTVAYYKKAHHGDNIDIGLDHGTIFKLENSIPESSEHSSAPLYTMNNGFIQVFEDQHMALAQLGNDSYSGSWAKAGFWDNINYCDSIE